jgi:hypothetical protein
MLFKLWLESRTDIVYHATYHRNLSGIAEYGLDHANKAGNNFHQYGHHSSDKTFFSSNLSNARFWISKLEMLGEHNSDNVLDDDLIPIILRFRFNRRPTTDRWQVDDLSDVGRDDYHTDRIIQPQSIQWWDGKIWKSVDDQDIDHNLFLDWQDFDGEEDEYGNASGSWYYKQNYPYPRS